LLSLIAAAQVFFFKFLIKNCLGILLGFSPAIVKSRSVENKASILQNCYKLKYQLDKVSIVEDFPKEERNRRKSLVKDLRRKFNDKNMC
jgi:hypothetical protein